MSRPAQQRSELAEVLLSFRRAFLTVGSFSFFINLLMLTPAIYMLQIYDRALGSRNVTTLLMLTLITLGLFGLMSLLEWIRSMVLVRVGARLDLDINSRVFDATFERNLRQAGQNPAQALSDLASMRQTLTGAGLIALTDAPWMPIYVLVIFMLHVQLGVFALVGVLLLVILAVVSAAIVAFIIYTLTMDKIREIAVLKLIGTRNRTIAAMILQQAVALGLIGFVVGKIAATWSAPFFPKYVLLVPADTVAGFAAVMAICVLASLVSIRLALRVDPAEAIGG